MPVGRRSRQSVAEVGSAGGRAQLPLLTASSNRSNSTSLIALFEGAGILNVRIVIFPKIIDTPLPGRIASF
jgi:hypothetical protein